MLTIFSRFIPVFFLLGIGALLRTRGVLNETVVDGLKRIIINTALPAILFLSFLTMHLEWSMLGLFAAVFIFCILLYGAGFLIEKSRWNPYPLSAFFFTGFEFGMVGVALYTSIFGAENLHYMLLLGLGHEFFIWFVYAPLLEARNHASIQYSRVLRSFFSSPIILAIIAALLLNLSGIGEWLTRFQLIGGVLHGVEMLSMLTTPLILLAIGYQLEFRDMNWTAAMRLIGLRLLLVGVLGTVLFMVTLHWIMPVSRLLGYAFLTFLLLPPPFIIPVFLGGKLEKEAYFYNNVLVLFTPVTLLLYIIAMLILA